MSVLTDAVARAYPRYRQQLADDAIGLPLVPVDTPWG
jgi:hypothetical protein